MPQAIKIIWTLSQERCGLLNHKSEGEGKAFEKRARVSFPLSCLGKKRAEHTQLHAIKSARGPAGQGQEGGPGES